MEFKTYIGNDYNIEKIRDCLLKKMREKMKEQSLTDNKYMEKIYEAVKKSGGENNASRYGLNKDILFADSELIEAFERNEDSLKYLQYRYEFKFYPSRNILKKFPLVMAVEASSKCNLRCKMCFQSNMDVQLNPQNRGIMSLEIYRKFLGEVKKHNLYSIVFASRGEPLLNPNIDKMIKEAKDCGVIDVKLNTNATMLTKDLSRRLIASGLDMIVFSVDSINPQNYKLIRGTEIENTLNNINEFLRIRKAEFPNSRIKVRVAMVLTQCLNKFKDEEIKKTKEYWINKVDEISIKSENEFKEIYQVNNNVINNKCSLLWERMYLWYDGKVNPCDIDHLSTLCVGNIAKGDTIFDIWNGDKMCLLRDNHLKNRICMKNICSNCNGY